MSSLNQPAPWSLMPLVSSSRRDRCARGALIVAGLLAAAPPAAAIEPPPVVFEGLDLAGFQGAESVAAALRQVGTSAPDPAKPPLTLEGIDVRGPSGPNDTPGPLAAELRSRIDRIDVAAGLLADPAVIDAGPSRWTGRIGLANDRATGRDSLELRTMLEPGQERSLIGVAVGPRVERRLGKGLTFFLDGQAEARALRSAESSWWTLPGTASSDLTTLGLTARTGLVR
jgi:hypothetical protein